MPMPNIPAIETFYWVSRLQSFHAAADLLHVTQPTVSYRIRELEESLGVQLFVRNKRKIQLTGDGAALFGYAEKIMTIAQDIESNVKIGGGGALRSLRLGITDSFAAVCLTDVVAEMGTLFPSIRLGITIDHSHVLTHKLSLGELDLSILTMPPPLVELELLRLGRQTLVWVGSPEFAPGAGNAGTAALLERRIFTTPPPSSLHSLVSDLLRDAAGKGGMQPGICNSVTAIRRLVRAGLGIGLLPHCLVERDLGAGYLQVIDVAPQPSQRDVFVGRNKGIVNRSLRRIVTLITKIAHQRRFCMATQDSPVS